MRMNHAPDDHVTVANPGSKFDGVKGVVACVYPSGAVDVDMLDGPDAGWIGHFNPEELRRNDCSR